MNFLLLGVMIKVNLAKNNGYFTIKMIDARMKSVGVPSLLDNHSLSTLYFHYRKISAIILDFKGMDDYQLCRCWYCGRQMAYVRQRSISCSAT